MAIPFYIFITAFSRCNEITFVFLHDAFDKLPSNDSDTSIFSQNKFYLKWIQAVNSLKSYLSRLTLRKNKASNVSTAFNLKQRLDNALLSFFELIINFATIYSLLPPKSLKGLTEIDNTFDSVLDTLYYSVTTITTLGYGDITPQDFYSKAISMYEVLSGIVILVFTLAAYMTYAGDSKKEKTGDKDKAKVRNALASFSKPIDEFSKHPLESIEQAEGVPVAVTDGCKIKFYCVEASTWEMMVEEVKKTPQEQDK